MEKKKIINRYNILGVYAQMFITVLVVIFGVVVLITGKYFFLLEFSMAVDLLVMAYNNHTIYYKEKGTVLYIVVGILLILLGIWGVI